MSEQQSEQGGLSEAGANLLADIMGANVQSLAATTDRIIENLESEIRSLRRLVVEMDDAFQEATVVDRKTERRWWMLSARAEIIRDILERRGELA